MVPTNDPNPLGVMKSNGLLRPRCATPFMYSQSMAVDGYAAPWISWNTFPLPAKNSQYSNSCRRCGGRRCGGRTGVFYN